MSEWDVLKAALPEVVEVLGCHWGRGILTDDDREPCPKRAVRIVMIHAPSGIEPKALMFRFCARHLTRVEAETNPHGGTVEQLDQLA